MLINKVDRMSQSSSQYQSKIDSLDFDHKILSHWVTIFKMAMASIKTVLLAFTLDIYSYKYYFCFVYFFILQLHILLSLAHEQENCALR